MQRSGAWVIDGLAASTGPVCVLAHKYEKGEAKGLTVLNAGRAAKVMGAA